MLNEKICLSNLDWLIGIYTTINSKHIYRGGYINYHSEIFWDVNIKSIYTNNMYTDLHEMEYLPTCERIHVILYICHFLSTLVFILCIALFIAIFKLYL